MKANSDKCHFITNQSKDLVTYAENSKLTFDAHIDEICKKVGHEMNALS